ncbi:hypothetical protein ACFE04_006647 [Oxalis oulophora]
MEEMYMKHNIPDEYALLVVDRGGDEDNIADDVGTVVEGGDEGNIADDANYDGDNSEVDEDELADVLYASDNDDEEFDELKTQAAGYVDGFVNTVPRFDVNKLFGDENQGTESDDPDYNVSSDFLDDSDLNWSITDEEKLNDNEEEVDQQVPVVNQNVNEPTVEEDPGDYQHVRVKKSHKFYSPEKHMFESFVSPWFKTDLYKDLYKNIPFPMVGRDDWPETMEVTLAGPPARLKSGRPQQKRYPEKDEKGNGSNATRKGRKMRCQYCFKYGHNKRACPERIVDEKKKAEQAAKEAAEQAANEQAEKAANDPGNDNLGYDQHIQQVDATTSERPSNSTTRVKKCAPKRRGFAGGLEDACSERPSNATTKLKSLLKSPTKKRTSTQKRLNEKITKSFSDRNNGATSSGNSANLKRNASDSEGLGARIKKNDIEETVKVDDRKTTLYDLKLIINEEHGHECNSYDLYYVDVRLDDEEEWTVGDLKSKLLCQNCEIPKGFEFERPDNRGQILNNSFTL